MTRADVDVMRVSGSSTSAFMAMTAAYLGLVFVLGGASQANEFFDLILRLGAIPLMGWALFRLAWRGERFPRGALLLLGVLALLPALQLIPLPPELWAALPGRSGLASDLAAAGVPAVWRPFSLTPVATLDALFGLIPFAAVFLAAGSVSPHERGRLWAFTGLAALLSVALGALQVVTGPIEGFRLYDGHGRIASSVFANRNHWAVWLIASMPLLAWLYGYDGGRGKQASPMAAALLAAVFLAFLAGVAISGSRAGAILLLPAVIGCVALLWRARSLQRMILLVVIGVATGIVTITGAWVAASRFGATAEDFRLHIWADSLRLAATNFPLGTGAGSFSAVYASQESPDRMTAAFINQAHNDWIEIFLEYGILVLAPIAVAAVLLFQGARKMGSAGNFMLLALTVLLAASFVDYPLRTPALQALAALLLAGSGAVRPPQERFATGPQVWRRDLRG